MLTVKIDVDAETYEQMVEEAVFARRPLQRHGGIILRRAFGLPFPSEALESKTEPAEAVPA